METATTISQVDLWSYAVLFIGVTASWIGIPIVGGAVMAGASVLAGNGGLDLWLVILVASAGASIGGYVGYLLGVRAGTALSTRPGRWRDRRQRALSVGERFYRRWGPLAVFLTPTWVSGALRMPRKSFLIWNALAAIGSSVVTVFGAYAIATAVLGDLSLGRGLAFLAIGIIGAAIGLTAYRCRVRCRVD
jgi:membrane protein DedA with SNARE-associated domain